MHELVVAPDERLITPCVAYGDDDKVPQWVFEVMLMTAKHYKAVGLAANQIGLMHRIMLIGNTFYINPVLIKESWKKEHKVEGCISNPGVQRRKYRSKEITVSARGRPEHVLKGLDARIFLHELDHLNGVPF